MGRVFMITKDEAEKIIEKHFDVERLRKIIRNTSVVAWDKNVSEDTVDEWLENFSGKFFSSIENEKRLALWLLSHFTYYSYKDIRVLCKNLFNNILHERLKFYDGTKTIEDVVKELAEDTIYLGLGNNSESSHNILYYFRQENRMSKDSFSIIEDKQYENLVFIDDVSISGSQALEYAKAMNNIKANNKYAGFLIATNSALTKINDPALGIKPITTMVLDDRDKAFSTESYVFSDDKISDLRSIAKQFCELYGKIAVEDIDYMQIYPLGFADGEYLIGFQYNIPDNTLPIFWGNNRNWTPLFKRYNKIYGTGKENALDGRKYY